MKFGVTIQKPIAFFLLLVFAFSNTPKPFLHQAFANHKDVVVTCTHEKNPACIHEQGYNCHFDNLVVNAAYVSSAPLTFVIVPRFFNKHFSIFISPHYSSPACTVDNKGPPSIA